jgi:ubiquitin-protein ligase
MIETPQYRRLRRELQLMRDLENQTSLLKFQAFGDAPVEYLVTLSCGGLVRDGDRFDVSYHHRFALYLDADFPLTVPRIVWQTPIFHPNVKPPVVCIGDSWFPGSSLAALCETICAMVQLKSFNLADPLDGEAAAWLDEALLDQTVTLPIDGQPVRNLLIDIHASPREKET